MTSNYVQIRKDNEDEYSPGALRMVELLLADLYADRAHFIYELLQNAEDALRRRTGWSGPRTVTFDLDGAGLRVSHYGIPFDEKDVRGVCGVAESTKDQTSIGRFGVGFKSVYAFTDRPEIHSGTEAFAIENFFFPVAIEPMQKNEDETLITIPFSANSEGNKETIAKALFDLGTSSLLFLSEIDEIVWTIDGSLVGHYLRESVAKEPSVRQVTVVGHESSESEIGDQWLVFSQPVYAESGEYRGEVEVAWNKQVDADGQETIAPARRSPLVVYFPTVLETHLGLLIQGPYNTTPSRENVRESDAWNQMCMEETGELIVNSVRWLRDVGMLSADVLECLPIVPDKLEGSIFMRLHEQTKLAVAHHELLPTAEGGYVASKDACLGRTDDLRRLLAPDQLASLLDHDEPLQWLHGSISRDRTPTLRGFLMQELGVQEVTPDMLLQRLTREFLEEQTDEWIVRLYRFLGSQKALRQRAESLPIVRLFDGSHVPPFDGGAPLAFLPGSSETSFPTVRASVCSTTEAMEFLESLGLSEPDPVDNVVRHVLPKYDIDSTVVADEEYAADISVILAASRTDSHSQREKLGDALGSATWVKSVDGVGTSGLWSRPTDVYLATERLQQLFDGVTDVRVVDNSVACLRGEETRNLLERAGASRHLRLQDVQCDLSDDELVVIRRSSGLEKSTWDRIEDKGIQGLDELLDSLLRLDHSDRRARAGELWSALGDLYRRGGAGAFQTTYSWSFNRDSRRVTFPSAFVRQLNDRPWVPDSSNNLRLPALVFFEETGWEPNSYLQSIVEFKPSALSLLARETGIEAGLLDLLLDMGVTSEAALRERLGITQEEGERVTATMENGIQSLPRERRQDSLASELSANEESEYDADSSDAVTLRQPPGATRPRDFVSYVAVTSGAADDADPDELEHAARMDLEASAIEFILDREPDWRRTRTNNPGFDLYRGPSIDSATQWCEVKAMTGTLDDRPVGMSAVQFECAQDRGNSYWLYVVERAGTDGPQLVAIQDPAGKAKTFMFDRGWRSVAADDERAGSFEQ